jgi:hypothetical protein
MQTVYIKFLDEQGRTNGFYELATRARVTSLPGRIYQIPIRALELLQQKGIEFIRASDEEIKAAQGQIKILSPL